jgi:hypothetical protein
VESSVWNLRHRVRGVVAVAVNFHTMLGMLRSCDRCRLALHRSRRAMATLSKTEVEKVIRPGEDARHVAQVMPDALSKRERREFEERRMAHELLKYKLHKLKEKMTPKKREVETINVDATNILYRPEFLVTFHLHFFSFLNAGILVSNERH